MLRESQEWSSASFPDVLVIARGRVPVLEGERFAGAVGRVLKRRDITGGARLRITGPNRDDGPLLVQVNLRVGGAPARVQTVTHGHGDALPIVLRLERHIAELSTPWRPRPWPDYLNRQPPDASVPGELTRRKLVTTAVCSPLAAAAVMDAMDYDVHLFTDTDTDEDAVVYRARPSGVRLARQHSGPDAGEPGLFAVNPGPAPMLTDTQAADLMCEHGLPFLFYTDPDSGRGHLVYRRYDAHLTEVTPTELSSTTP